MLVDWVDNTKDVENCRDWKSPLCEVAGLFRSLSLVSSLQGRPTMLELDFPCCRRPQGGDWAARLLDIAFVVLDGWTDPSLGDV